MIVAACVAAVAGYAAFSIWAVLLSGDEAMIGDVGGTWKSFAVPAFGFWLGSSSGGKASSGGDSSGPTPVTVENPPSEPVPTKPVKIPEPEFAQTERDEISTENR